MPKSKATANAAPTLAVTSTAQLLGPPLANWIGRCISQTAAPTAYCGSRVVPVWKKKKKKGSAFSWSSFRPIALLVLEAMLFAGLYQQMLQF
eukprot:775662-Amphidinium_carterae.1